MNCFESREAKLVVFMDYLFHKFHVSIKTMLDGFIHDMEDMQIGS